MWFRWILLLTLILPLGCEKKTSGGDDSGDTAISEADADTDTDTDTDVDSDCLICEECTDDSDCDVGGGCYSFDGGTSGVCSMDCSTDGSCPGNSVCWEVEDTEGNTGAICLNDDADTVGPCEGSWTCE